MRVTLLFLQEEWKHRMKRFIDLWKKITEERRMNPKFDKAHKMVCAVMAVWAAVIIIDRGIGFMTNSYDPTNKGFVIFGGIFLVLMAFLGTRGYTSLAMAFMEINVAVFVLQFVASCVSYKDTAVLWRVLLYGLFAVLMIGGSLLLFLNYDIEDYRARLKELRGKTPKAPRYYRKGSRLIRNKDR